MEETGRGHATPHVLVRFMTHFREDDPAIRRIGLIIERELQEGMRREILSAVRRAVRVRLDEYVRLVMLLSRSNPDHVNREESLYTTL